LRLDVLNILVAGNAADCHRRVIDDPAEAVADQPARAALELNGERRQHELTQAHRSTW
jgi:hypothetical protein